jgi:CheY-like chemotaxis protein
VARILVIYDDSDVRAVLHDRLAGEGYEVDQAADGVEGIQAYRRNPPDLVILNYLLPRKSGTEVLQELRRDYPVLKAIVTTVYPIENLPDLSSLGVEHILMLPYKMNEELFEPVRKLVGS